jgi:hypothetical protein
MPITDALDSVVGQLVATLLDGTEYRQVLLNPAPGTTHATPDGRTWLAVQEQVVNGVVSTSPFTMHWRLSGRHTNQTGTSDDTVEDGLGAPGAFEKIKQRPSSVWPGPRTKLVTCPILFIRANAGDLSGRPIVGPFWESPDILVAPGVAPDAASLIPANLGGFARANADNTVYAHVWNLGQAPAIQALVEFYWFNACLGFKDGDQNLIGFTHVDLGPRGGVGSHLLVKCPNSWKATYVNGGHECLVVRVSQSPSDPLSGPPWDAAQNRHVAQRNIHPISLFGPIGRQIALNVGPLFSQSVKVEVAQAGTETMPWLHLATNSRTVIPQNVESTGDVGITKAVPLGADLPNLIVDPGAMSISDSQEVIGDDQKIGFVTRDPFVGHGFAHVYRITASQNDRVVGGYTVVLLGDFDDSGGL